MTVLLGFFLSATPAISFSGGQQIYSQRCAKCHGKEGQGVKGKYDDALFGDWALEKLTRYITKSMPDDDPGTVTGPDAEAVARYIYDSFYSREARARNHPARIELARLTNRQYVNTVADLLKSFTGPDKPVGAERGLRGSYRMGGGRRNGGGGKTFERVDRQVNFTFDTNLVEFGPLGTNSFFANWRGSVLPEESGEYEFVLKTPNGARLWVNDDETPLIDASVASGADQEHRARTKLIAGRAYPIRLEHSKAAKDKTASVALCWKPPPGIEEVIPQRCLSPSATTPTFVVTTPFPPDDSSVGYERGVSVSKAWDEATTHAAIETAGYVVKRLEKFAHVKAAETNRAAKLQSFCNDFAAAAFRRPLTDEQKRVYVAAQFKAAKPDEAVKRVLLLALKSPRFLYLGLDKDKPDAYEVASRLSFSLLDSLPDGELLKAAGDGALAAPEAVKAQAQRILADPRAEAKLLNFLQQWLQVTRVEDISKDAQLYPGFTPEVAADLRTSLNLFLKDVLTSDSADYRKLLLADYLFVNGRLAQFYGLSSEASDEFVKVPVDPRQRSGVLTHPYLLAAFSYQKSTSPIHRGVFLTRNIVGRALKPPPMAVAFKEADFKPDMTMREKVAELTRPQACQTCHSVINPLGFSLEHYDAVGRFRTRANGREIDAVSDYITDDGNAVRLTGARDVANFAVNSEHAQNAFIEQLFHQLVKQPMLAYGASVQEELRQKFVAEGYNIRKLVVEIATVAAANPKAESRKPKEGGNPKRESK